MTPTASPPASPAADSVPAADPQRRFGGVARLYGAAAAARFRAAHVCVIGLGGVGSWAAEALARSAVGRVTLIDMDHIAESNVNRQIHALGDEFGKSKIAAMAARMRAINPVCRVTEIDDFITPENVAALIDRGYDYVIDCIDGARAKAALIAHCRARGMPLVTVGSAGGQTDPTRIQVRDLARTEQEPLLAKVRKRLRQEYGFPRKLRARFGIEAVFSDEPLRYPEAPACDLPGAAAALAGLNCAGFGSSVCVTAAFGFVAASRALAHLAAGGQADAGSG